MESFSPLFGFGAAVVQMNGGRWISPLGETENNFVLNNR